VFSLSELCAHVLDGGSERPAPMCHRVYTRVNWQNRHARVRRNVAVWAVLDVVGARDETHRPNRCGHMSTPTVPAATGAMAERLGQTIERERHRVDVGLLQ